VAHLRDIPELRLCSWWHLQAQQHWGQPRPCTVTGRRSGSLCHSAADL